VAGRERRRGESVTGPTLPGDLPTGLSVASARLGPVTDPAHPGPLHTDADTARRLATIRALLAQAEATPYPAEAEAFTAKAAQLMARHALDEALVWADGHHHDAPTEASLHLHRPFVAQKAVLVATVARAFRCRAIRLGRAPGAPSEAVAVVGFRADLELVELLVTSLLVQLTTAMTTTPSVGRTAAQVASWRRSFIMGFTAAIGTRLEAEARRAATDRPGSDHGADGAAPGTTPSATSTALVLADREGAVGAEYRRRYPHVRSSSVSAGSSAQGHRAGAAAGRSADLGHPRLGGRRAIGSGVRR